MGICIPAFDDCPVCQGKGYTLDDKSNSHACWTCWGRITAKATKGMKLLPDDVEKLRRGFGLPTST